MTEPPDPWAAPQPGPPPGQPWGQQPWGQQPWQPPPQPWEAPPGWGTPAPRRGPRTGVVVALAVVGGLMLLGVVSAIGGRVRSVGETVTGRTGPQFVSYEDLQPGDCTSERPIGQHVVTVAVAPCAGPHVAEVFTTWELAGGDYPGDAEVRRQVLGRCRHDLPEYVGGTPGSTGYSLLFIKPTERSWRTGQRTGVCLLEDPGHASLLGSAKGAGANPN